MAIFYNNFNELYNDVKARYVTNPPISQNVYSQNNGLQLGPKQNNSNGIVSQAASSGINALSSFGSNYLMSQIPDTELGRTMGTLFSTGINSATNTISNNILKGNALTQGLGQNVGTSLAGAGVGIGANYLGRGIAEAGGDTRLSRAIGAGVASGVGTIAGTAVNNALTGSKAALFGKGAGSINPYGLAATVVGSAIGAATGPSKEYGSKKYGKAVQIADTIYDAISVGINAVPGWGQLASGMMVLNKGLSNVFGSTDGMTFTDAFLGSSFTPFGAKWMNMWGAKTTDTFKNQSWQNIERTNAFMGDAFGNLNEKFDIAREEANKTYGTFSRGAYRDAQSNIEFANQAWPKILGMTNKNDYQNVRAYDMSSINNQRYAQKIQGGWNPVARGKLGMKIFNNATNHNIGMRLLSGAALIDNKQMILCSAVD